MMHTSPAPPAPPVTADPVGFVLVIAIICVFFWIWALTDCLRRDFRGDEKLIWVLVLIFLNILGAVIYFFIGRPQGTKQVR